MSPMSAESTVVRNYLDWLLSLPWGVKKKVKKDIDAGRDGPRTRTTTASRRSRTASSSTSPCRRARTKVRGPILCLVGPPGVGKTSLGKSIAKATGRDFVRMSLGGVRDEAEIRGHRRTYIGSMPGRIIQSMKKAKSSNPLFLLDEIDKLGVDYRGDPSAASARSAGSRAELDVQRPLSRSGLRSVGRAVHHHRQQPQHAAAACSTAWRSSASPATPRMRRSRSPSATCCRSSYEHERPEEGRVLRSRMTRSATWCAATRARPACARSNANSSNLARKAVREIEQKKTD